MECREQQFNSNSPCDPTKAGCGRGQEYVYDIENRLVAIHRGTNDAAGPFVGELPNQPNLMEFIYDALGRRIETIEYIDAATGQVMDGQGGNPQPRRTRHVYFGLELIQEYSCGADGTTPPLNGAWPCSTSMPLVREFIHGDPERYPEAVAMIRHNPDTQDQWAYHYLHDVLGSVIGLVDEAGQLVERYTYDPYGKVFIEKWDENATEGNGAFVESAEPNSGMPYSPTGNPFMWTGHRYDPAVGLYHTKYRSYEPVLGRWLQRDPIEYAAGSINLYEYVLSNPLYWYDPFGQAGTRGHVYPTHLGGHPDQPLFTHSSEEAHNKFHASLRKQGYGFGDAGRDRWREASEQQRDEALDKALQESEPGLTEADRHKLIKDARSKKPAPGENCSKLRNKCKEERTEGMRGARKRARLRGKLAGIGLAIAAAGHDSARASGFKSAACEGVFSGVKSGDCSSIKAFGEECSLDLGTYLKSDASAPDSVATVAWDRVLKAVEAAEKACEEKCAEDTEE